MTGAAPWVTLLSVCSLEVQGPRELKFFPGVAHGGVYPGFKVDPSLPAGLSAQIDCQCCGLVSPMCLMF